MALEQMSTRQFSLQSTQTTFILHECNVCAPQSGRFDKRGPRRRPGKGSSAGEGDEDAEFKRREAAETKKDVMSGVQRTHAATHYTADDSATTLKLEPLTVAIGAGVFVVSVVVMHVISKFSS